MDSSRFRNYSIPSHGTSRCILVCVRATGGFVCNIRSSLVKGQKGNIIGFGVIDVYSRSNRFGSAIRVCPVIERRIQ